MKIYIAHSRNFDYQKELYQPVRNSLNLPQADIILPHEDNDHTNNSREFYNNLDLVIAEVSYPATGLGIELGWAADDKVPIYCIYRQNSHPSGSLYAVSNHLLPYSTESEMLQIIQQIINENAER